jgi:phage nucleotide-binding protein
MEFTSSRAVYQSPPYVLIYGASGVGKTSLVKTLPQDEVIILDAEQGLKSLGDYDCATWVLARDASGAMLAEEDRFERFKMFCQKIKEPAVKAGKKYIVIDSISEVSQNIFRHMKAKTDGGANNWQLWGDYKEAMIDLLKFFRDVGHYTIVFLALEERVDEDDTGRSYYVPSVGGKKVKEALLPVFDEVFRLVVTPEGERILVTQPTEKTQAKDRSGKLSPTEKANLADVLRRL